MFRPAGVSLSHEDRGKKVAGTSQSREMGEREREAHGVKEEISFERLALGKGKEFTNILL